MSRFGELELRPPAPGDGDARRSRPLAGDAASCLDEAFSSFNGGDFEMALRWFGRVLEHDPGSTDAWLGQVRCLMELAQWEGAQAWADTALDRFPESASLLAVKAQVLGRRGLGHDALPFSDAALELAPEDACVWLGRGDVLLSLRSAVADSCFDRACRLCPQDWWIRWMTARTRAFWGHHAAALGSLRDAATLAPDRFVVWWLSGECHAALGLDQAAEGMFQQALALRPGHPGVTDALHRLRQRPWHGRWGGRIRGWLRSA